jgi:hypothetical protein
MNDVNHGLELAAGGLDPHANLAVLVLGRPFFYSGPVTRLHEAYAAARAAFGDAFVFASAAPAENPQDVDVDGVVGLCVAVAVEGERTEVDAALLSGDVSVVPPKLFELAQGVEGIDLLDEDKAGLYLAVVGWSGGGLLWGEENLLFTSAEDPPVLVTDELRAKVEGEALLLEASYI